MTIRHIVYIHGFNSSPQSLKAQALGGYLAQHQPALHGHQPALQYHVPALSYDPQAAIAQLQACVEPLLGDGVGLVGSSLGGFYATWLVATYDLRAVLVNPAVRPDTLLNEYIGENINHYTGERYTFSAQHVRILRQLDAPIHDPQSLWVLLQRGDDVLDYRLAVQKYSQCPQQIEAGGSHGFDGFERYFERIVAFLARHQTHTQQRKDEATTGVHTQ